MRIAFLSPFYPYRGGIAQFSDSLYLSLSKSNDVKAFTFTRQYPGFLFPGKTQYVSKSDVDRGINAERVLDSVNPLTYRRTAEKIREFSPNVILISYWMPFFAFSLGRVARILKKICPDAKIVSVMHNVLPHEKRAGDDLLTRFYIRQNTGFVVLNDKSKDDLLKLKPDTKYIVLPHPLYNHYGNNIPKAEACSKLGVPPGKKVMLFFGLIRSYKGVDLLLETLAGLDDSYYLIIAGEVYGSFDKYNEIIKKHSLSNRVLLHTKFIPESEIALYFSAADVCVLPYRSGTQSGIEGVSYHFGLPVIVTDVGGLKETVEKHKTGLVVPRAETALLKEAVLKYFNSSLPPTGSPPTGSQLRDLFEINIAEYKKQYSWDTFSESLLKFCEGI
jgi:glycosyltransferase involved in cell wall biosynthesis